MNLLNIAAIGIVGAYFLRKKENRVDIAKKSEPGNEKPNPKFRCPPPTLDIALNTRNRQNAIDNFLYGPPNPALESMQYWKRLAEVWQKEPTMETLKEVQTMRCANCSFFDESPQMLECLPPNPDEYDKEGLESTRAVFGYCWPHAFKLPTRS